MKSDKLENLTQYAEEHQSIGYYSIIDYKIHD